MYKKISIILMISIAVSVLTGFSLISPLAADEVLQVEFEDYLDKNPDFVLKNNADNTANMAGIQKMSNATFSYTIEFDVPSAGNYTLQVMAAGYAAGITENYSDVKWSLNGGEAVSLDSTCTKNGIDTQGSFMRTLFTTKEMVELAEGKNTVVMSAGRRSSGPMVVFALDYARFVPESVPVETPEPEKTPDPTASPKPTESPEPTEEPEQPTEIRFEIEDITDAYIVSDVAVSGGKFQMYKSTSTEDVIQRFSGKVSEAGDYTLSIACANYSKMPFLSQMYFSVNGGEYIELNESNCSAVPLEKLSGAGAGTFDLYAFTFLQDISLESGAFTIDVKSVQRLNTDPGAGIYFALDYLCMEKKKKSEPVIGKVGRQEIEDKTSAYIVADANASGGKYQMYKTTSTDDVIQRFSVDIPADGAYTIKMAAGCYSHMEYLSQMFFSVNGEKYVELADNTCKVTKCPALSDASLEGTYGLYDYAYNEVLYLKKGINTIDIKGIARLTTLASAGVYFSLDYVDIRPVKTLEGLFCETENGFVPADTAQPLTIYNGEHEEIAAGDVDLITYDSSEPNVAFVDAAGNIHGRNFGEATVTAHIQRNGEAYQARCTVYVTDKNGLYLTGGRWENGAVSVSVHALADYHSDSYVLIAVYGTEDGYRTSLKGVHQIPVDSLAAGGEMQISQPVSADRTDKIGIFLINSLNSHRAVYKKILI